VRRREGVLLYGMYDLTGLDKAPKVRIEMMTRALSSRTHTERIVGGRFHRAVASLRWLVGGGPRRVGAVYVESVTTSSMPTDLAFLLLMRLLRRPVGVYFRDAYQLYRDTYPRQHRRQILSDWAWRLTKPLLARVATVRFVQSAGLGEALHLRRPVLLPPGTDPSSPDLGAGRELLVAYVGGVGWADGFDMLVDAMAVVRARCPEARLLAVGPSPAPERRASLPAYVELRRTGRDGLVELLRDARVCVIPRPITEYTNFVIPIKLWDYLSYGKPVVATAATETARVLEMSDAGLTTPDTAEGIAEGLLKPLLDEDLARRLAANARAFACLPGSTWDARAGTVLESLGLG
jgi:glycosyltransferase involved in cell wall biosynthesis